MTEGVSREAKKEENLWREPARHQEREKKNKKEPHHSYKSVVSHSRLVVVLAGDESHGGATASPLPLAARLSQHSIRANGEHGVPILLGVERIMTKRSTK